MVSKKISTIIIFCLFMFNNSCIEHKNKTENIAKEKDKSMRIGMEQILGEYIYKNDHYFSILFGEGFHDKAFFIALFKDKIYYNDDGSCNQEKALLYKYVDLKDTDFTQNSATRYPTSSKIDFENKELILIFNNGDTEKYLF